MRALALLALTLGAGCGALIGLDDVEGPDFAVAVSPERLTLTAGGEATFTVTTTRMAGRAELLALSLAGLPDGIEARWSDSMVPAGGSVSLTLRAGREMPEATMSFTVTALSDSHERSAHAAVALVQPSDFAVTLSPPARQLPAGASATFDITTRQISGRAETVTLAVSGLPDGVTGAIDPPQITAGGAARLTIVAPAALAAFADRPFTVRASAPSATHEAAGTLAVTNDFTLSLAPPVLALTAGGSVTTTVTATITSGPPRPISLAAELPAGVSAVLDPPSLSGSGSSRLTLTAASSLPSGRVPFTVRAASGSGDHSAAGELQVSAPILLNGTFEDGTLDGWYASGVDVVDAPRHGGAYAAWIGAIWGNSSMTQAITVPRTGTTTLAMWVYLECFDLEGDDDQEVIIRDTAGYELDQPLWACLDDGHWTSLSVDLTRFAGQTVYLYLHVWDDNDGGDTSMYVDDITVTTTP